MRLKTMHKRRKRQLKNRKNKLVFQPITLPKREVLGIAELMKKLDRKLIHDILNDPVAGKLFPRDLMEEPIRTPYSIPSLIPRDYVGEKGSPGPDTSVQMKFTAIMIMPNYLPDYIFRFCFRKVCKNPNAGWWNFSTRQWYCESCARLINECNPGLCVFNPDEITMTPEVAYPERVPEHERAARQRPVCYRNACGKKIANWWNTSTEAWCCESCADRINSYFLGLCVYRPNYSTGEENQ